MEAIREHRAAPALRHRMSIRGASLRVLAGAPRLQADGAVEVLGCGDLEALHAAREREPVTRLDEEVDVVALDADVNDAKRAVALIVELA
jgi:hypothetical protein